MITKEALTPYNKLNIGAILTVLSVFGIPETMIDIGSGSGIMTEIARRLGTNAIGIDIIAEPPDQRHDLNSGPIDLNLKADLIITIETAEHIENESAFLQTIQNHTKQGTILVFTAAVPGQAGHGHINCQPLSYWREKLEKMGYHYNRVHTGLIGEWWRYSAGGLSAWLTPNLQVFSYGGEL